MSTGRTVQRGAKANTGEPVNRDQYITVYLCRVNFPKHISYNFFIRNIYRLPKMFALLLTLGKCNSLFLYFIHRLRLFLLTCMLLSYIFSYTDSLTLAYSPKYFQILNTVLCTVYMLTKTLVLNILFYIFYYTC